MTLQKYWKYFLSYIIEQEQLQVSEIYTLEKPRT